MAGHVVLGLMPDPVVAWYVSHTNAAVRLLARHARHGMATRHSCRPTHPASSYTCYLGAACVRPRQGLWTSPLPSTA